MTAITNNINSFPSEFVPKAIKQTKAYALKHGQAFHSEGGNALNAVALSRNNKTFKRMRQYMRAEQSQLQYKELMGLKRQKDLRDRGTSDFNFAGSYRNINYENLKIIPRLLNQVVSRVLEVPLNMRARPIDPNGISEKQKYRGELLAHIIDTEHLERLSTITGMGYGTPSGMGEMPPTNVGEVDAYMDMNPRDMTAMEVLDWMELAFENSKWENWNEELVRDIAGFGIGGTRQYTEPNGKVKSRKIEVDRCIANVCTKTDFSDLIRFGEYRERTISQLRKESRGALSESDLLDIANKVAGQNSTTKYTGSPQSHYSQDTFSYAYDHEKVTVLDAIFKTVDVDVKEIYKTANGNRRVKQKDSTYIPFLGDKSVNEGKGMSYDDYNQKYINEKSLHRTEEENIYQYTWVVDTDHVYNYGLMPNMMKTATNWQEVQMPVAIFSTNFMSSVEMVEQQADQAQLNFLHYQSHMAQSRPPGIAIEKNAFARVGKGVIKWDVRRDLEMYAETGNLVYHGLDAHGNPLQQKPFEELVGGMSEGIVKHWELCKAWIMEMREQLGLNDITSGATPAERTSNQVADYASEASDTAMAHIRRCYKKIYEQSAQNMYYLLQNNMQRMQKDRITESLGSESFNYFYLNRDIPLIDMGIILDEGPDATLKADINLTLDKMVDTGAIDGVDAIRIKMVKNPYRQLLMIKKHNMEREQLAHARELDKMRTQSDAQTQQALAVEKAKAQQMAADRAQKAQEARDAAALQERSENRRFVHEMMLKNVDLTEAEKERRQEMLIALVDQETQLAKQKLANQKPVATSKS